MKMLVALIDSQHGSLIWVEASETERWQNGKMERTAAKNILCEIMKLCKKQKFLASRL